jgi:Ergosterol biosynthesis ERG4/ERG24 family
MRWAFGYLLLFAVCSAKLAVEFLPIARNLELVLPTWQAWRVLTGYIFGLAVLSEILPGKITMGAVLNDLTHRLQYKVNGLLLLGLTVVSLAACVWNGYVPGSWIADHHAELFASANVLALLVSTYLFVVGRLSRPKNWLRPRSVFDDFIMGAELNPHILGVDVKFFSYRPSMIGWLLINLSFLCKQYDLLGFVTSRMLLYQVLTAWYVWDYFVHESKMVYTWDIIAEHFGFMLIWGDYVFIPFAFSIQNLFLLRDLRPMGLWGGYIHPGCIYAGLCRIPRGKFAKAQVQDKSARIDLGQAAHHRWRAAPGVRILGYGATHELYWRFTACHFVLSPMRCERGVPAILLLHLPPFTRRPSREAR